MDVLSQGLWLAAAFGGHRRVDTLLLLSVCVLLFGMRLHILVRLQADRRFDPVCDFPAWWVCTGFGRVSCHNQSYKKQLQGDRSTG